MDYQRDEHRFHRIVYQLVWTPKRRKAVLTDAIALDCQALITTTCTEKGWTVLELVIQPDQVRLLARVWPTVSAAEVVKECKGVTSHELRLKYPDLHRLPSMWTRSYFAATVGAVESAMVTQYIEAQKGI